MGTHSVLVSNTETCFCRKGSLPAGRECRKENSANVSMQVNVEARILFYNETCFEMPGVHSQPIPESLGGFQLTGAVMKVALISLSLSCLN